MDGEIVTEQTRHLGASHAGTAEGKGGQERDVHGQELEQGAQNVLGLLTGLILQQAFLPPSRAVGTVGSQGPLPHSCHSLTVSKEGWERGKKRR